MKRALILSTALWASLSAAQPSDYEVTVLGGMVFPESDTRLDDQTIIGGEIQYNTNFFLKPELQFLQSLETDFTEYPGSKVGTVPPYTNGSTFLTRVGLNAVYDADLGSNFVPFIKAGVGYETLNDYHYWENEDSAYTNLAVGAKYFFSKNIALKVEGLYMQKLNDPYYDMNYGVLGGLTIAFGGEEAPKPVKEEPKPEPKAAVTPPDSDHDGVIDPNDKCPDTPVGVKVDANGCPLDSDGDGIADYMDKCPDTEAGTQVDSNGCPLDSDGDGVVNSLDKCPNSAKGFAVDADGCELAPEVQFSFGFDSAKVPEADVAKVKTYGSFLQRNNFGVKVTGYTDSTGPKAYNQKLSEKRAASVAKIIEGEGVAADRIETLGKGEADPIADNGSKEGRAKNRRVELERLP